MTADQNIYLVSGQSATALLQDQAPPPPVQGTLTVSATGNTGVLYSVSYTRDNVGRITQKTETVNSVTNVWGYAYDQQGRLDSVSENGTVLATYGYDPNGNRISVNGQTIASYDNQDRLLTYANNSYSYNANGEMTGITTPAGSSSYAYNALGSLTDVTLGSQQIHYIYDGQNRLVGKEVNGTLTEGFLYDGQLNPVAELDGNGNIVEQFVYGTRPNVPDYIIKGGSTYRVITDQVGSPVLIVDASNGQIAEQISYDVWGNVLADSNTGFQPFGFAGGLNDSDTGFVRFGAREYDPQTGRWVSRDPILFAGGDTNLYGYAIGDPISNIDPTGQFYIPFTHIWIPAGEAFGAEAAQYWANQQVATGNWLYAVPGLFASLWTPCTSSATVNNLAFAAAVGPLANGVSSAAEAIAANAGNLAKATLIGGTLFSAQPVVDPAAVVIEPSIEAVVQSENIQAISTGINAEVEGNALNPPIIEGPTPKP